MPLPLRNFLDTAQTWSSFKDWLLRLYDHTAEFNLRYYGPLDADPTLNPLGGSIIDGDMYFRTSAPIGMMVCRAGVWVNYEASSFSSATSSAVNAAITLAQAALATTAKTQAESARDTSLIQSGTYPTEAAGRSKGVKQITSLVAGTGGTNGTFALAFTGGAGSSAAGYFIVAGGIVTTVVITYAGYNYTSAPTVSFSASAGLTGASATAVIADVVADGEAYKVQASGGIAAFEYRRTNSSTSTLIAQYPGKGAVEVLSVFTRPGYIDTLGQLQADANWQATELIPIYYLEVQALSLYGTPANFSIAFYNANRALISGVAAATVGGFITAYPAPPAGAVFVAFTRSALVANAAQQGLFCAHRVDRPRNAIVDLFPDELSGRLAVPDGAVFPVRGVGPIARLEYQRTSLTTSAQFAVYPEKKAVAADSVFTRTGYLNLSGALINDANWQTTALLSVLLLDVRGVSLFGATNALSIAFYDADGTLISGVSAVSGGAYVTVYPTPPTGAVFVAFTRNSLAVNMPAQGLFIALRADRFQPPATNTGMTYNIDYATYATLPGFINTAGALSNSDVNWLSSDFIPAFEGETVVCDLYGNTAVNSISYYDINKQLVSAVRATSNTGTGALVRRTVVNPVGTAFLRISHANNATNTSAQLSGPAFPFAKSITALFRLVESSRAAIYANRGNVAYSAPRKLKLLTTDGVLLYGDSIFSNSYPWLSAAIAGLTGAVVTAGGFPGASSAQLAANVKMQTIYDSGARLVIVMTGGNDSGAAGTVGTFSGFNVGEPIVAESSIAGDYVGTTYIQSISHIMRKFNAYFGNIRARAALTGSETEAQKTAKIDAVLKPVLVFCSGIPRNIANSSDVSSQQASWLRKRNAVVECAVKYKVHCVDLMTQLPWDMSLEPYYVGPTDTITNNGVKTMDGVHPNKYGDQDMAEIICADVGI